MQTKLDAARIATGAGIPVVLTAAERIAGALAGEPVGTLFHATGRRRPTRLLWLAHATEPVGTLLLDDGAVAAVTQRRASLLAAGVTGVVGTFHAGDPVAIAGRGRYSRGPRPGQLRLRRSSRRCSAAPRRSSSASSARPTSVRWSTATTWCCSDVAGAVLAERRRAGRPGADPHPGPCLRHRQRQHGEDRGVHAAGGCRSTPCCWCCSPPARCWGRATAGRGSRRRCWPCWGWACTPGGSPRSCWATPPSPPTGRSASR